MLSLFGLYTSGDVQQAIRKLRVPAWALFQDTLTPDSSHAINWGTLFVHLCEARQALQILGYPCIRAILDTESRKYRVLLKSTLQDLFYNPRRPAYFAVVLLQAVAHALEVPVDPGHVSSKGKLWQLAVDMARLGFSPKASVLDIPEWITLIKSALLIMSKLKRECTKCLTSYRKKQLKKEFPSVRLLREMCQKHSVNPRPYIHD